MIKRGAMINNLVPKLGHTRSAAARRNVGFDGKSRLSRTRIANPLIRECSISVLQPVDSRIHLGTSYRCFLLGEEL
jgi:hypothetical protein